jgi:Na+/H+ antiporter NhaD/arsenite permease-like protein
MNRFSFGPIREVAVVFAGIFSTMIPALALLNAEGGQMGLRTSEGFFWAAGALSSFLDNAPTYLAFLAMATGIQDWAPEYLADCLGVAKPLVATGTYAEVQAALAGAPSQALIVPQHILTGVSLGAVFMGANTYIGNGPNFMVRAIASEAGVKMPSFFGYMLWSGVILLPLFFLVGRFLL